MDFEILREKIERFAKLNEAHCKIEIEGDDAFAIMNTPLFDTGFQMDGNSEIKQLLLDIIGPAAEVEIYDLENRDVVLRLQYTNINGK